MRETIASALAMGREILAGLGVAPEEADDVVHSIRVRDLERLEAQLQGDTTRFPNQYQVRSKPLKATALLQSSRGSNGKMRV